MALSDDGEIRLAGFGLAAGILPALGKPRLSAADRAATSRPRSASQGTPGKNSDVYSVGVHPARAPDRAAGRRAIRSRFVKGVAGAPPPPVAPEILAVLRMALAPPETRYRSSGDLRRELGKLLFSGPYSPSTFNLAYFLNELFRNEIEAETRARRSRADGAEDRRPAARTRRGSAAAPTGSHRRPSPTRGASGAAGLRRGRALAAGTARGDLRASSSPPPSPAASTSSRGGRPRPPPIRGGPPPPADLRPTPTLLPELAATPSGSDERDDGGAVPRRGRTAPRGRGAEARGPAGAQSRGSPCRPDASRRGDRLRPLAPTVPDRDPSDARAGTAGAAGRREAEPTAAPVVPTAPLPTPLPARAATREGALVALEDVDTPPRVARVVKPVYPPLALQARIGGIVVLRVLVSEKGAAERDRGRARGPRRPDRSRRPGRPRLDVRSGRQGRRSRQDLDLGPDPVSALRSRARKPRPPRLNGAAGTRST